MQNYYLRTLIKESVCHYLPGGIRGGRGIMKNVTNCDIGGEGGLKFGILAVTSFFNDVVDTVQNIIYTLYVRQVPKFVKGNWDCKQLEKVK